MFLRMPYFCYCCLSFALKKKKPETLLFLIDWSHTGENLHQSVWLQILGASQTFYEYVSSLDLFCDFPLREITAFVASCSLWCLSVVLQVLLCKKLVRSLVLWDAQTSSHADFISALGQERQKPILRELFTPHTPPPRAEMLDPQSSLLSLPPKGEVESMTFPPDLKAHTCLGKMPTQLTGNGFSCPFQCDWP